MPTALAGWTSLIVDFADEEGLPADQVLEQAGLDRDALAQVDGRVPVSVDDYVWHTLSRLDGGPGLGLRVSERMMTTRRLGVVGFLGRATGTLGQALEIGNKYHPVVRQVKGRDLVVTRDSVTICQAMNADLRHPGPPALAEVALANYVTLGRAWAGVDWSPAEVRFQQPRPRDVTEYERFFRCPVYFSQPINALVIPREVLALPIASAEPELVGYLQSVADSQLAAVAAPRTLAEDVRYAVRAQMVDGDLTIENVARRLGTGPRSLQRRLSEEGGSFRAIVDAVRHQRALELLSRRTVSQEQMAEELGFSEPRAFRRAFRRWTGEAPSRLILPGAAGE